MPTKVSGRLKISGVVAHKMGHLAGLDEVNKTVCVVVASRRSEVAALHDIVPVHWLGELGGDTNLWRHLIEQSMQCWTLAKSLECATAKGGTGI